MSMHGRDEIHIGRIKDELNFIENAIEHLDQDSFLKNETVQRAVSMSLITIGECANHLSNAYKENHPEIEWIEIIAVRNIAAHGYWQLNMAQIWKAMEEDIPKLIEFFDA